MNIKEPSEIRIDDEAIFDKMQILNINNFARKYGVENLNIITQKNPEGEPLFDAPQMEQIYFFADKHGIENIDAIIRTDTEGYSFFDKNQMKEINNLDLLKECNAETIRTITKEEINDLINSSNDKVRETLLNHPSLKNIGDFDEQTFIHYGTTQFDPEKFVEIINWHVTKPGGGFWAVSVNDAQSWKDWSEQGGLKDYDESNYFQFTLKDDAKILYLDTIESLSSLPVYEKFSEKRIDFEKITLCGIDAIYTNYSCGDSDFRFKMNVWDCDSLVVLNKDSIMSIDKKLESLSNLKAADGEPIYNQEQMEIIKNYTIEHGMDGLGILTQMGPDNKPLLDAEAMDAFSFIKTEAKYDRASNSQLNEALNIIQDIKCSAFGKEPPEVVETIVQETKCNDFKQELDVETIDAFELYG